MLQTGTSEINSIIRVLFIGFKADNWGRMYKLCLQLEHGFGKLCGEL